MPTLKGCLKVLHLEQCHVLNPDPLGHLESLQSLNLRENFLGEMEELISFLRPMGNTLVDCDLRMNPVNKSLKYRD